MSGKCKNCKNVKAKPLSCQNLGEEVQVSQFEVTKTPYTKTNKEGKEVEKISKKTEKVQTTMKYENVYTELSSCRSIYLKHKYQLYNDSYHWSHILSTVEQYGCIYHMDFSENLTQAYKYEPQSSHFNKKQYSLHCTVKHTKDGHKYLYHLSDEKKHDQAFTSVVVDQIVENSQDDDIILRFKSDNCATQYKSKWVFRYWLVISIKQQKIIIFYCGVTGHGKGLVDAMSGFGVKGPVCRAIITQKFDYNSAEDIYVFLTELFDEDHAKDYFLIDPDTIRSKKNQGFTFKN